MIRICSASVFPGCRAYFMTVRTELMLIQKREHYDVLDMNRDARYRIDASKVAFGLLHTNYEARIRNIIRNGFHVRSAADLKRSYAKGAYFVLWYDWTYSPRRSRSMKSFATIFGIWHELMRSSHNGLHECMVYGKRVLIINVYSPSKPYLLYVGRKNFFQGFVNQSPYAALKPQDVPVFVPHKLAKDLKYEVIDHYVRDEI